MSKRRASGCGAAFPSPTAAEMAEITPTNADLEQGFQEGVSNASVIMQVPERIVQILRPDLKQSTPFKLMALKTPPPVLTLSERPLDFLEIHAVGRLKIKLSVSENAVHQNGQLVRTDSMESVYRQESLVNIFRDPHYLNSRQGLLYTYDLTDIDQRNKIGKIDILNSLANLQGSLQCKGGRKKVTLEAGSEHKSPREGSKIVLEAEPETKRLGKNVSLQELFYLSLFICLPQLILKILFCR
ncbi:hypothetical protein FD755_001623 [Muntiacus reevesi]|uniref:Mitochondrial fission factor n=1 Tax=Muntiacus reevesi TaxID=9886 RepID=A0A5J5N1Q8_MUNRE|nr:hypothetical protein FD755_001623 [Muntiacus reevesi]